MSEGGIGSGFMEGAQKMGDFLIDALDKAMTFVSSKALEGASRMGHAVASVADKATSPSTNPMKTDGAPSASREVAKSDERSGPDAPALNKEVTAPAVASNHSSKGVVDAEKNKGAEARLEVIEVSMDKSGQLPPQTNFGKVQTNSENLQLG